MLDAICWKKRTNQMFRQRPETRDQHRETRRSATKIASRATAPVYAKARPWQAGFALPGSQDPRQICMAKNAKLFLREPLARISHQPSITTADIAPPASLRSVGRPWRIAEDTPSAGICRKPCGQYHLSRFTTKAGEKSGLVEG